MSNFLSFHLSDSFIAEYQDRPVDWGFDIGAGNSLSELTFLTKYSRKKADGTKEKWYEVCRRCIEGMYSILKDHCAHQRTPWNEFKAQKAAQDAFDRMFHFKWTPPGRGMWSMGTSFVHENQSNSSLNNCANISTEKLSTHSAYEATMPFARLMEMSMCIAKGSWILTTQGPRLIEDLDGPQDVIVDGEKFHAPLGAWKTGTKPVISLETINGYSLRLTSDHQVQRVTYRRTTGNVVVPEYEWVEAGSLVPGEKIRMNSHSEAVWNGSGTFDEGYLVGAVLGDGWKEANSFVVAAYYKDPAAFGIRKQCETSVAHVQRRSNAGGWRPKNSDCEVLTVGTWVRSYLTFEPKAVTDSVEATSRDFHIGFLRGLFDADGGVIDAGSKGRTVRLTQSNLDTLKRVQRMLHRLGIKSSISVKRAEQRTHEIMGKVTVSNPSWTLSISRDAVLVFREVVGFSEGHKSDLLQSWTEDQFYHSYPDATIKSVDDLGVCDVYDMTVPEIHAFDANGFYVHNCGVGVGFDTKGAGKLTIWEPTGDPVTFVVPDTREGWAESISVQLESYFFKNRQPVHFDYSEVRPAGAPLKSFGGTASGPGPLMDVHASIDKQFAGRNGEKISSRDIVDIMNKLGKAVVAGGARRSALIALGDAADDDYVNIKNWDLPENAERTGPDGWAWTSNNSVLVNSGDNLDHLIDKIAINGEPGVIWLDMMRRFGRIADPENNRDYRVVGCNPCAEISLESHEFCCLVELYPSRHDSFADFKKSIKHAYMYAKAVTLMPSTWAETNEVITRNRRIGVSMTGIVDFIEANSWSEMQEWMDEGYGYLSAIDTKYSEWLGVRNSVKLTTVKPAGTTSIIAGTTSGVHWPTTSGYYIRRIRFHKTDPVLPILKKAGYHVEDDVMDSKTTAVVSFPTKGLEVRSEREVSIWEKASLAAMAQRYWADNMVSVTVSFKEDERKEISPLLRSLQGQVKSLSFLPISEEGTTYAQAPYEPISEEEAIKMMKKVKPLDLTALYEKAEEGVGEKFCTTDVCEVSF